MIARDKTYCMLSPFWEAKKLQSSGVMSLLRQTASVSLLAMLVLMCVACSSNTTLPQQVKHTPTTQPLQKPTATVSTLPKGTLLYRANWSRGLANWPGAQGWKIEQGQLMTQSDTPVAITLPYTVTTPNYAIEARVRIVRLLHRDGGYFSIFTQPATNKDGYQAGVSDLKGTEPRPNGSHAQVQAFIDPMSSMAPGSFETIDYEPHFDWHTYRVEIQDNQVGLSIDGISISTANSTRTDTLSNGPISLGSAMIVIQISDLTITAL